MLKDAFIKRLFFRSLKILLGIFVPEDTFEKLIYLENENTAKNKFVISHVSMVLSIGYAAIGFLFAMAFFALFAFNGNYFLGVFSMWTFLGVPIAMLVISQIKYFSLKFYIDKYGEKSYPPPAYFYGMWNIDIILFAIGGLCIGLFAAINFS